jgi:hypothetical protein
MVRENGVRFWQFWGKWQRAPLAGLAAGMVVFVDVGSTVGEALDAGPPYQFGVVLGAIGGLAFGLAQ